MQAQAIDLNKDLDEMTEVEKERFALEVAGESTARTLFALVSNRFAELQRRDTKFTQQQLADRMGLNRSQISRWMEEPSNMTVRSAAKLLAAMGCSLELSAPTHTDPS